MRVAPTSLRLGTLLTLAASLGACASFEREELTTHRLVIPTDDRPVQTAEVTPPPVTGGTLLVTRDGAKVVVADPDRDRLHVVDIATATKAHTVELRPGDGPGRSVEGLDGTVYVTLRGPGEVATLDVATGAITARRRACAEPRGMAYDASLDALYVACASGELVTFAGGSETPTATVRIEPDLRDVVLHGSRLFVSRFKTAELLEIDRAGAVLAKSTMPISESVSFDPETESEIVSELQPGVAWRSTAAPDGTTVMVHQRALSGQVELEPPTPEQPTSYGGGGGGGGPGCGAIVQTGVSIVDHAAGSIRTAAIAGAVLPVDIAVSETGLIAIASAGVADLGMPRPFVESLEPTPEGDRPLDAPPEGRGASLPPSGAVSVFHTREIADTTTRTFCRFSSFFTPLPEEPVVAVAFTPGETPVLIAQAREPATLYLSDATSGFGDLRTVQLDTSSRRDTGHDLFHRDTGAGIACASCHPEGGEDGHVWRFSGLGPRRTQALDIGLAGTAPFHWDGTLGGIDTLMEEVFVGRMGGARQSSERLEALQSWMFQIEAPEPMRAGDDPAVVRGRTAFAEAGCATCHGGPALTNNATMDVGTGGAFQVPSLVGIGYRAPFIHTGCAETLEDRFDPACGGDAHGAVEGLAETEVADLVAYLQSL